MLGLCAATNRYNVRKKRGLKNKIIEFFHICVFFVRIKKANNKKPRPERFNCMRRSCVTIKSLSSRGTSFPKTWATAFYCLQELRRTSIKLNLKQHTFNVSEPPSLITLRASPGTARLLRSSDAVNTSTQRSLFINSPKYAILWNYFIKILKKKEEEEEETQTHTHRKNCRAPHSW